MANLFSWVGQQKGNDKPVQVEGPSRRAMANLFNWVGQQKSNSKADQMGG